MVFLEKTDLKLFNIKMLKKVCKIKGIDNYSKLNKNELFGKINQYLAVKTIQQYYRSHFYKNATDHITLEKVEYPCFIFRTKIGKYFCYSYDSIIKYIMKTGDTRDPMTRIFYSDEDLSRLDSEVKYHFPDNKYKSTLKIKKNINYARRIRNRENEILSFQMRLDEIKINLLTAIESDIFSWDINESLVVDNTEYSNVNSYINSILYELKLIIVSLKSYDIHSVDCFITSLLSDINNLLTESSNNYNIECTEKIINAIKLIV